MLSELVSQMVDHFLKTANNSKLREHSPLKSEPLSQV